MLITCEICGVPLSSLVRWHEHLISEEHQQSLKTQIRLHGTIATGGRADGKRVFLLRLPPTECSLTTVKGHITKFSRYGILHNLIIIKSTQYILIVYLELG